MQTITIKIIILIIPVQMHLDVCTFSKGFFSAEYIFPRAKDGLRAAHLNQQVVVTGGDDGGTNYRDEVLCGIL